MSITKAQSDTYKLINSLVGEGSVEAIKPIAAKFGGSFVSGLLDYVNDDSLMETIDDYAMPFVNQTIEDFVKSNSRLEKMRVWFNNKGI